MWLLDHAPFTSTLCRQAELLAGLQSKVRNWPGLDTAAQSDEMVHSAGLLEAGHGMATFQAAESLGKDQNELGQAASALF